MPIRSDGEETRTRILKAAGEAFGRNGFHRVTNKDISMLSGANTAAVSYYFRDKAGLYREAWAFLQTGSASKYGVVAEGEKNAGIPQVKLLLKAIFDWMHDEECWDSEILRYEMTEPTGLLDHPERDGVLWPLRKALMGCLCVSLGLEEPSLQLELSVQGVIANFRAGFQIDGFDREGVSQEELFDIICQGFLRAVELNGNRSAKGSRRSQGKEQYPELGVTDEVDPFMLKPLTKQDLLIMRKVEAEAKKATMAREDDIKEEDDHSGDSQYLQPELW